ncbi:hypothetical protein [Streptomyces ipomoeae]|uniref:hypothetical protein n=1 Tax=Streptomyces ipomoeae TaxID=103232 RepID=UPI0029AAB1FA|nr:hypothetical protein [Streptomyces ipomoeae]MDX2697590.1 hypothetical protein [Streptomyces ipomoeae]MDX2845986.1 hypothetical protein [Streptomyces ipomoeae]
MSSTWRAHVRIEKNGEYGEYNDTISALSAGDEVPTPAEVTEEVTGMIINHSPQLKGGEITHNTVRRIK